MHAIKNEQKRNQRLIDLTAISENSIGADNLNLARRGNSIYCYLHCYQHGRRVKKQYLGKLVSAPVRAHVANRIRRERLQRLQANQDLLQKLAMQYQDDTLGAILAELPATYRTAVLANTTGTRTHQSGIPDAGGNPFSAADGKGNSGADNKRNTAKRTNIYTAADDVFNNRYEELRAWATADFERNTAPFSERATYARDGTRMRSKGECVHYNLLQEFGILFRYDSIITVTDQNGFTKNISPDFLIQCFDGSLLVIEHLGMLYDKNYSFNFGEKLYWYMQKGFYPGKNLFITSDDIKGGTDSRQILAVVKQVEQRFYGY